MPETAQVLARDGNAAVVHLDRRQFPGLMLQGDTFNGIMQSVLIAINAPSHDQCREELRFALADLQGYLTFYERTVRDNGFELPYSKSNAQ